MRLSDLEQKVLLALSNDFVSTTVVKCRAKLPTNQRIGPTLQACIDLERYGLAECVGSGPARRWRRSNTANAISVLAHIGSQRTAPHLRELDDPILGERSDEQFPPAVRWEFAGERG